MTKTKTPSIAPNQHRGQMDPGVVHHNRWDGIVSERVLSTQGRTSVRLVLSGTYPSGAQREVDATDTFEGQAVRRFIKAFTSMLRLVRDAAKEERKSAKVAQSKAAVQSGEQGTCPCCFGQYQTRGEAAASTPRPWSAGRTVCPARPGTRLPRN